MRVFCLVRVVALRPVTLSHACGILPWLCFDFPSMGVASLCRSCILYRVPLPSHVVGGICVVFVMLVRYTCVPPRPMALDWSILPRLWRTCVERSVFVVLARLLGAFATPGNDAWWVVPQAFSPPFNPHGLGEGPLGYCNFLYLGLQPESGDGGQRGDFFR